MKIKMTVIKLEDGSDAFRLKSENPIDLVVTNDSGTEQIQKMFVLLLGMLRSDNVEIEFEKTEDYGNAMYEDVCKEYVNALNSELKEAREALLQEGYTINSQ